MYFTCFIILFLMNSVSNCNGIQDDKGINLDFNRIQQIPDQKHWLVEKQKTFQRTQESFNNKRNEWNNAIEQIFRNYDDGRRNFYPPKQDPKLFYQSEMYKKIVNNNEISNDISSIVLDRNVQSTHVAEPIVMNSEYSSVCVKCPHDMTLIAKPGSDRVLLQMPRVKACSGYRASRHFYFKQMYGPQIGSLIEKGSHMIVGRVMKNNMTLQMCKLQVHVITQGCPMPKYLIAYCDKNVCDFTCRNQKLILYGHRTLTCGSNLQWNNKLPLCKAPSGCEPPSVPNYGHISCKGVTKSNGPKFLEGTRCRVLCQKGWKPNSKPTSVCRRGSWTRILNCTKKVPTVRS